MTAIMSTRGEDPYVFAGKLKIKGIHLISKSTVKEVRFLLKHYLKGKSVYGDFGSVEEKEKFRQLLGLTLPDYPGTMNAKSGDTILCALLLDDTIEWATVKVL